MGKKARDCCQGMCAEAELHRNLQVPPGLSDYLYTAVDKNRGILKVGKEL